MPTDFRTALGKARGPLPTLRTIKAILLGFGRGIRRVDASKSYPTALSPVSADKCVLDWLLAALSGCGIEEVVFVGGYHIQKVMERYPKLKFYYYSGWQEATDAKALAHIVDELKGPCLISKTDILFRSSMVERITNTVADVGIVAERRAPPGQMTPMTQSGEHPFYYAGLTYFNERATARLRDHVRTHPDSAMEDVLKLLRADTLSIQIVEADGDVGPADAVAQFVLGSKAKTLSRLQPVLRSARILDQICFTASEWADSPDAVVQRIQEAPWDHVVVRSSARQEDGWTESNAGRFKTVLDVKASSREDLCRAINEVLSSYVKASSEHDENEIFVQPQLRDIHLSGVCLTRELESGAPYYVINYDGSASHANGVTSGCSEKIRTVVVNKLHSSGQLRNPFLAKVVSVAKELEYLLEMDALDIEFAVNHSNECTVLQVRPIVIRRAELRVADADFDEECRTVRRYIDELSRPAPFLLGTTTILGVMPDWNPAEMIGTCPRPLAQSLYEMLITDGVWAEARARIGYRDVTPTPLLISLAARPYIDVRASLNSFLPTDVPAQVGAKLVNGGLETLRCHPEFHDKIEFEIAVTCLDLDFDHHRSRLVSYGLSSEEIRDFRESLGRLTNRILREDVEPMDALLEQTRLLRQRCHHVLQGSHTAEGIPRMVQFLLEDCRRYGTLPFSILARYAFIATAMLRSLERRGVFSPHEVQRLLTQIPTVATAVTRDLKRLTTREMSQDDFLQEYGHLRPGTYNILSPTYRQMVDHLTRATPMPLREQEEHSVLDSKRLQIGALLREEGLRCDPEQFLRFIYRSVQAREQAKFEFTRNISAALDLLTELGQCIGLTQEEISFLPLEMLSRLGTDSPSGALRTDLQRLAASGAKRYRVTQSMRLPHLICEPADLDAFELFKWHPNFITRETVLAPVQYVDGFTEGLTGKIVAIESADPGYDWLFGHAVAGLITQYGGVASHMAVRAAEFGLPAAIGCGEVIFKRIREAHVVELDCSAKQIRIVR